MKKLTLFISLLCTFVQYAIADGYDTFHQAHVLFSQGKFSQAKTIFTLCLNDPAFADVKGNMNVWISKCEFAIQEQNRNAQLAAERHKKKRTEIQNNQYVYISVNATQTGEIYTSTVSAMSEVLRLNGRGFCPNIEDALTVVTVSLDIKNDDVENGFYKAKGNGVVRLGSAIEANNFVGQWSVDCEATSAVNADDAKRLLLNKLNHKLGYALDNLLNGRPQESGYYIPEQAISVYINPETEKKVPFLRGCINSYISKAPGVTLSNVLDETSNKANDDIAKIEGKYVKMESRTPIHEYEGFSQVLRISYQEVGENMVFIGNLEERIKGQTLTTVTINGADFGITDLTAKNQELAAKLLAVGLGFKEWEIGEDIGGFKLAWTNGMHGLLLHIDVPKLTAKEFIQDLQGNSNSVAYRDNRWRYPYTKELENIRKNNDKLGLKTKFWSADGPAKNKFYVVNFEYDDTPEAFREGKYAAAIMLVKEF